VIVVWLLTVAILAILGIGLEGKLSTRAIYVDGTQTQREHQIVSNEFGGENAVVVMLRGPRAQLEAQGRRLARRFEAIPDAMVLSPWSPGGSIAGLRPRPGVATFIVNVHTRPGEGLLDILPVVRRGIHAVIGGPVHADIAGAPAIVESIQSAIKRAAEIGELVAIPVLLVVLLLVFRSVLAAAMPVVVGGSVVLASRGLLSLFASAVHIEALALGALGMMGLALGVDYSLLIVSRFREELRDGADIEEAARTTVSVTGRTVLMAGCGLSLAMAVTSLLLPAATVISVAIAVVIASVLSVASALLVVPALLMVLGPNLDRWSLRRRGQGPGWASRWSNRLSGHPRLVVLPLVFVLVFAAAWAFTLDSGIGAVKLLPDGDPGRRQQEAVQQELGPGWVAPLEIVMADGDGPVTTPRRIEALADFQRRLERDPGVATMTGFAGFERTTRKLSGFEGGLFAQQRGTRRLGHGLDRVHHGAVLNTDGLLHAAAGAGRLDSALGATHGGAGALAQGLDAVSGGSQRLVDGLGKASGGSGKLVDGSAKARKGAGRLSKGLERARKQTQGIKGSANSLESTMRSGERRLSEVDEPVQTVEAKLTAARESLQRMTTGRGDPQYAATLEAVEAASLWLTGIDPQTGEKADSVDGVVHRVSRIGGQLNLGLYLSRRLGKNGEKASAGMKKLVKGSAKLDDGLEKLESGTHDLYRGIARLSKGGEALPPGLSRLEQGAERLASGLGQIQSGAGGLAGGLGGGAHKSKLLSGALRKIGAGVERSQGGSGESQLDRLHRQSPGLFRSGFFYLASLDGTPPAQREQTGFLISLDHGGSAARMLVIPRYDPSDSRASGLRDRLDGDAESLARRTGTEVRVGGVMSTQLDVNAALRDRAPIVRLGLALVTFFVLLLVLRSLLVPILSALLNILTVAATFGFLALLFDGSFLGGPGYVDAVVIPATIMVVFGLAIDYEVFVFARMREEYDRTGSAEAAIRNGLSQTAPVVTGAAIIMIVVFLSFSISSFATMRNFGVAQAIGVAIDAFMIRLIIVPAMMRALGERAWWTPRWLDRLLPGKPSTARVAVEEAR
jgi:RND superfamily putative drug exporter